MAYDATYPASSDTVSASKLRENFLAVLEGRVDHEKVTLSNTSPPGTGSADKLSIYAKDVSSKAELHAIDEDNNEVQLTSAGRIGSSTTNATFADIRIGTPTTNYTQDNFIRAWGYFAKLSSGTGSHTLNAGVGLTSTRSSKGLYTVAITNALTDANYGLQATVVMSSSTSGRRIATYDLQTSSFKVRLTDQNNNPEDEAFSVWLVGGTVA
jgi:hypothetical protein